MKYKIVTIIFILFFVVSSAYSYDIGDDIRRGKIPLPDDARVVRESRGLINMGDRKIYSTSLSKRQLLNFYRKELSKRGWSQLGNLADTLKKYGVEIGSKATDGSNLQRTLQDIVQFKRNNTQLALMFLPYKLRPNSDSNYFSLYYAQKPTSSNRFKQDKLPRSIPKYPNAKVLKSGNGQFTYSTPDSMRSVISFYKSHMRAGVWELTEEEPLEQRAVTPQLARVRPDTASCAECGQNDNVSALLEKGKQMAQGATMSGAKLVFSGYNNQKCTMYFTRISHPSLNAETQISITYR